MGWTVWRVVDHRVTRNEWKITIVTSTMWECIVARRHPGLDLMWWECWSGRTFLR